MSCGPHLFVMDKQRIAGLGLEPVLTTSELAEYLGVHVQAIYDLRTDGRGRASPLLSRRRGDGGVFEGFVDEGFDLGAE